MADKCAGCTNKYGFFERPSICPECHRAFCQTCLPYQGKKVKKSQPQISLEPCVYCSRQKAINKAQEREVMSNFKERFYDRAHLEAPIQSKLRLDLVMRQNSSGGSAQKTQEGPRLSEEDRALEERLKRLKESHEVTAPSYSEEEMRKKLEHLRDEGDEKESGNKQPGDKPETESGPDGVATSHGTQSEQADRLMDQATDEVRLDNRLAEEGDANLLRRFQELKGNRGGGGGGGAERTERPKVDLDIQQFLDEMEEPPTVGEADSEQLLRDLRALQAREETAAWQALKSEEVQGLVSEARRLAREDQGTGEEEEGGTSDDMLANISYPKLPEDPGGVGEVVGEEPCEKAEVLKLLEEGRRELVQEEEEHEDTLKFVGQASERLERLRDKEHLPSHDLPEEEEVRSKPKPSSSLPEEEEVRSKPKGAANSHGLDFTWGHFGSHKTTDPPPSDGGGGMSAADQLGVGYRGGGFPTENGAEFDGEVQDLIARMLEEAELDRRLEDSGLDYRTSKEPARKPDDVPSVGATALPPPPAPITVGVGAAGGGAGACGLDELPWCCICNDNATLCCYDCDGDLYCGRCFTEGHQQFGLTDHHHVPFEPKK